MDWTFPDLTAVPGDQGMATVDLTQSDGSAYYGGISVPNLTGAPQYPGDPTADNSGNQFAPASVNTVSLLPDSSTLQTAINDLGSLVGIGTQLYAAANQYTRVPVNAGGATGTAIVNSTTGLPAGSGALAQSLRGMNVSAPLLLLGAAALFFALR